MSDTSITQAADGRQAVALDTIVCMDALELCHAAADAGIRADMILADLPYGAEKTQCDWDVPLSLPEMWEAFKRVIKPRGAIVLTCAQPFSSQLITTATIHYRYSWYWEKSNGANLGQLRLQPMRVIEEVAIFSLSIASANQYTSAEDEMVYFPQKEPLARPYTRDVKPQHKEVSSPSPTSALTNARIRKTEYTHATPRNLLRFKHETDRGLHPTQKPVALFSYLIRTYTQPGELVLDPTCGSGTTAIAARSEGRHFICGDISAEYVAVAQQRLAAPWTANMFAALETAVSE